MCNAVQEHRLDSSRGVEVPAFSVFVSILFFVRQTPTNRNMSIPPVHKIPLMYSKKIRNVPFRRRGGLENPQKKYECLFLKKCSWSVPTAEDTPKQGIESQR